MLEAHRFFTHHSIMIRYLLISIAALGLSSPSYAIPVIYELFTSQGCSSCPPADKIVSEIADTPGLLVLSYHITYWNRLGWTDPYSFEDATIRQRSYARAFNTRRVYTPQGIVQGQYDVVGNSPEKVAKALANASEGKHWIAAKLMKQHNSLTFELPATAKTNAELLLIGYQKQAQK